MHERGGSSENEQERSSGGEHRHKVIPRPRQVWFFLDNQLQNHLLNTYIRREGRGGLEKFDASVCSARGLSKETGGCVRRAIFFPNWLRCWLKISVSEAAPPRAAGRCSGESPEPIQAGFNPRGAKCVESVRGFPWSTRAIQNRHEEGKSVHRLRLHASAEARASAFRRAVAARIWVNLCGASACAIDGVHPVGSLKLEAQLWSVNGSRRHIHPAVLPGGKEVRGNPPSKCQERGKFHGTRRGKCQGHFGQFPDKERSVV
jgi:hypothetical protein